MSSDKRDLPHTGDGRTAGRKPRMQESAQTDASGKVDWSQTSKAYPMIAELQRKLKDEGGRG